MTHFFFSLLVCSSRLIEQSYYLVIAVYFSKGPVARTKDLFLESDWAFLEADLSAVSKASDTFCPLLTII